MKSIDINGLDAINFQVSDLGKNLLVYIKQLYKDPEMPQTKPIVSIENVVASASVDQEINLIDITKKFPDTEYHPEQFPGLVFRLKTPRTATLVFRTGKMVCTGAKSEEMAIKAVRTVVQKLRKGGIKIKKDAVITVQNIVAAINLGGRIHLELQELCQEVCMSLNNFRV